jgi:hypothetical protein
MNIFVLSLDHQKNAEYHLDKHVVKMPLETAQMLCSNLNKIGIQTPYLTAHANHPCTLWAGMTRTNFSWLCELGFALCMEYTYRYEKTHKCEQVIELAWNNRNAIKDGPLTQFAQAMPDEYKDKDAVTAYRNYYKQAKSHIFSWKKREVPEWLPAIKTCVPL